MFRPEDGVLGVIQIVAPHLALAALVLVPLSLLELRIASVLAAALLVAVVLFRFGGDWVSVGSAAAPRDSLALDVTTWNVEVGANSGIDTVSFLRTRLVDVVAIQELQPAVAAALDADPDLLAAYPYRVLEPRDDVRGMGLLSRLPILRSTFALEPAIQEASLDLGEGRTLAVLNVHPFHAEVQTIGTTRVPIGLDSRIRNDDLDRIRGRIDALVGDRSPLILLGDLNTAASEPAFDRFVSGLREVHREVGIGPGWTWRPSRLEFLGIGILRIDHVVVSLDVVPLAIEITCPPVGDHCLVRAQVAVNGG